MIVGYLGLDKMPDLRARPLFATAKLYGIDFFYFTPERVDMDSKLIRGLFFEHGNYVEKEVDYPDLIQNVNHIYNSNQILYEELKKHSRLVYHGIGGKMKIGNLLENNIHTEPYTIKTYFYKDIVIDELLEQYKAVILKADFGNHGDSVWKLSKEKSGVFAQEKYVLQRKQGVLKLTKNQFEKYDNSFKNNYVVQQFIHSRTDADCPFHVRIYVQRGANGEWGLTKIYPRIGMAHAIASNAEQGGGTTGNIKDFLPTILGEEWETAYKSLVEISKIVPPVIQSGQDNLIESLGIDTGINMILNNEVKIYEVNSYPETIGFEYEVSESAVQYYFFLYDYYYKNTSDTSRAVWGLKQSKKALVLRAGESDSVSCTLDRVEKNVHWKTDDPQVVKADDNGNIYAVAKGNTFLAAHFNDTEVLRVPAYVERDALPPLSPIPEPRFVCRDGVYINPNADKTNTAVLMFAGDMLCLAVQQENAYSEGTYNFNTSFEYIKRVFAHADFVAGSLETMLSHTSPYKLEQPRLVGPVGINGNNNAPATFLAAARYAGFDALVTANNHNLDTGIRGILETLDNLHRYDLPSTGMFTSQESERHLMFDINGIRIALFSYTTDFNTLESEFTNEELSAHLSKYDVDKAKINIALARARGAEYIIVYMHWGSQNHSKVTKSQLKYSKELANAGADYIIGSHPHVLNKYDIITAKDGRKVPVMYSLGNIIGSMDVSPDRLNRDSIILRLELAKEGNLVRLANDGYIPCFICWTFQDKKFVTVPCEKSINRVQTTRNMEISRKRACKTIGDKIIEIKNIYDLNGNVSDK